MTDLDFDAFDVLTFDTYGTLIDWEAGLLAALRPVLARASVQIDDDALLEAFARHESDLEAGPYLSYREVLAGALDRIGADLGFEPTPDERTAFGGSVADWPAFPDSPAALAALAERFRLGVITNCDDDLFAASQAKLGVTFDPVVTAAQARSYKPSTANFDLMFARLARDDVPRERVLHVAQSLYHDHVPAKAVGLRTVWVDRRQGKAGGGATPAADAQPDLTVPDLASLAALATAAGE